MSVHDKHRDHFVYAANQWDTTLQCNVVTYWLGAYTKWSLQAEIHIHYVEHEDAQYFQLINE